MKLRLLLASVLVGIQVFSVAHAGDAAPTPRADLPRNEFGQALIPDHRPTS